MPTPRDKSPALLHPLPALCSWSVGLQVAGRQRSFRMSVFGSQKGLNMAHTLDPKPDLVGAGSHYYARSDFVQGAGNGFEPYVDGYTYTLSTRSAVGGAGGLATGSAGGGIRSEFLLKSSFSAPFLRSHLLPESAKDPETHQICIPGGFSFPARLCLVRAQQKGASSS